MSWAEVKKINSNMSKPLNEALHLYGSTNELVAQARNKRIKLKYPGVVNYKVVVAKYVSGSMGRTIKFYISVNDTITETRTFTALDESDMTYYIPVNINADDVVLGYSQSGAGLASIPEVSLCGTVGFGTDIYEIVE